MLKRLTKIIVVMLVSLAATPASFVYAQTQSEINPVFDPTSTEDEFIQLNYDCSSIKWPEAIRIDGEDNKPVETVRRLDSSSPTPSGFPTVSTYFLFFRDQGGKETYSDLFVDSSGNIVNPNPLRKLPKPFIITQEEIEDLLDSNPDERTKQLTRLEGIVGTVVCPNIYSNISGGNINSYLNSKFPGTPGGNYTSALINQDFKRYILAEIPNIIGNDSASVELRREVASALTPAHLIPPALQQIENYVIDIVYLFWSVLGIISMFFLISLGLRYMLSLGNVIENQNVVTQIGYWFLGLALTLVSIPFLTFLYQAIGISTTKCFRYAETVDGEEQVVYDLTLPGFTIFFEQVCTGEFAIEESN